MKKDKSSKKKHKKKLKFKFLKKIVRLIYNVLKKAYELIDKFIITPLAKLFLLIQKPFKGKSKILDRFLNNKIVLITLSLILSITGVFAIDKVADNIRNSNADILYNQPVKAQYNDEAYVIEGLPKTVDITLIGRQSSLYLAKQSADKEVAIDLSGLKPGTHKVNLKYNGPVPNVTYKLDPSETTVVIYEKMSESKSISKEILYENKLDSKYTISNITFSRDEVFVKGAQYKLNEISTVKALVDVRNITNPTIGTSTLKEIPLVAYDENGSKLDVEIVPATIDATIEIKSPSKEVQLKVVPNGNVVFGKAIEDISLSTNKVTIYGDQSALDKVSSIPVNINVDKLSKNNEYTINLSLPSGIKEISTKSVVAKVTLGDIAEKTIDNVNIITKNLANGLKAQAASKEDTVCSVIVKGTANNLKSITADNITASVNLQGLEKGKRQVKVEVTGEDTKLTYTPKTETVTIIIE